MSRWKDNAWGVKVDNQTTGWNFQQSIASGASFAVFEMNPTYDEYYPSWVNGITQPYQIKLPVVGIYNLSVAAYHRTIPDYGYYPLDGNVTLDDDKVWQHVRSMIQHKWLNVLVINFIDFVNDNGDPIPAPHVTAIVESAIERIRTNAPIINPNIKHVITSIYEGIIRDDYPDLGQVFDNEAYCMSDMVTLDKVIRVNDWSDRPLPPDYPVGFDGKTHSNPPFQFTHGWKLWKYADFNDYNFQRNGILSSDFQRKEGDGVMGAAIYNGSPSQFAEWIGVEQQQPQPQPDPDPEPQPNPEPEPGQDMSAIKAALMQMRDGLDALIEEL